MFAWFCEGGATLCRLNRSYSGECRKTLHTAGVVPVKRHKESRVIQTLDPTALVGKEQPVYDISDYKSAWFRFRTVGGITGARIRFVALPHPRDGPFPPDTRGVLYYHVDPSLPSTSGEIRFRLCDDLENFDTGQDLRISPLKRWSIPLIRIVHTGGLQGLVRYLLEEGLVKKRVVWDLKKLPVTDDAFQGRILHELSQPFLVDLEMTAITFHLVTRTSYSTVTFRNPFFNSNLNLAPYSGSAKVRWELSTMPEHTKNGPTLVLRILQFLEQPRRLTPMSTGPVIHPQTSSLALRQTRAGHLKPWTYVLKARVSGASWVEFLHHLQLWKNKDSV